MLHNNISMNVVCTHVSSSLSMYLHTVRTYVCVYVRTYMCKHVVSYVHVQGEDGDVGATGSPGAEGEKVS